MIFCFAVFLAAVAGCLQTGHSLLWALLTGLALFFWAGAEERICTRRAVENGLEKGKGISGRSAGILADWNCHGIVDRKSVV